MEKEYHLPVLRESGQYSNPLEYPWDEEIPTNPDPYVIKYTGKYYCYSSDREGVNVSVSENLNQWKYLRKAVVEADKHEFWAPCVIYDNGIFYMYCSNTSKSTDDCHQEFLQLYTSTTPEGPFTYVKTFFQKFSIDAHVVKDMDGEVYLFYSVNDYMGTDAYHSGTVILVDRLIDYTELANEVKPVVLPTIEEEVYEKNRFGDGRDWYTIEGAFFFRRRRKAYMMYAANAYVRENYFLGYSTADAEQRITDMNWNKYPDENTFCPLIRRNEEVEGTGHNSVIKAPDLVSDWIVYHGRNQEEELIPGTEQRKMRMDPLLYSGDRLVTNAPSYQAQDGPEEAGYNTTSIETDPLFTEIATDGIIKRVLEKPVSSYVMEADVTCTLTHMGGRYGLLLSYQDDDNYMELILDSGRQRIEIFRSKNHIVSMEASCPLRRDYNHEVIHSIRVERNAAKFDVYLDLAPILNIELDIPYGYVGTVTKYTEADTVFFAVTEHIDLFEEKLRFIPNIFKSDRDLLYKENRLVNLSDQEVTLSEIQSQKASLSGVEMALMTQDSRAGINITDENGTQNASIEIAPEVILIKSIKNGKEVLVSEIPNTEKQLTIYIKHRNGRMAVWTQGKSVELQCETGRPSKLEIRLKKAELTGYEKTTYTE